MPSHEGSSANHSPDTSPSHRNDVPKYIREKHRPVLPADDWTRTYINRLSEYFPDLSPPTLHPETQDKPPENRLPLYLSNRAEKHLILPDVQFSSDRRRQTLVCTCSASELSSEVSYQYLLKIKSRQPFFLDEMIAQN